MATDVATLYGTDFLITEDSLHPCPTNHITGREAEIFAVRDRKLAEARERRNLSQ